MWSAISYYSLVEVSSEGEAEKAKIFTHLFLFVCFPVKQD